MGTKRDDWGLLQGLKGALRWWKVRRRCLGKMRRGTAAAISDTFYLIKGKKDRKKPLPQRDRGLICGGKWGASDGSLYFAGTQAAGAGVDTAGSTVYNCLYTSDIGLPGTVRTTMRVRNLDTESNALTTNFAFCHLSAPPYRAI